MGKGHLEGDPRFVTPDTPNGLARLQMNLMVGERGSGTEHMLPPVMAALSEPLISGHNKGFLRDDAYLAIVYITDAIDQSDVDPVAFYRFLLELKRWDRKKVIGYGAIIPSGVRNCPRDGYANDGPVKMESFFHMVDGIAFSLCDPLFGEKLATIGRDLLQRVDMFVPLKVRPALHTVELTYGHQVIPEHPDYGWSYDPERVGIYLGSQLELEDQGPGVDLEISFVPAKEPGQDDGTKKQ